MTIRVDVKGIDEIRDLAAVLPRDLQRAHRAAARNSAVVGFKVAAKAMGDATDTDPGKWMRYQRVFSSVDEGTQEARAWMGLNDYPERNSRGEIEYIPFPEGFDPSEEVGDAMASNYVRILDSQIQKIIEGR